MIVVHKANLNYNFNSTSNNFYSNYFEYPLTDVKRCCIMKINEDARCDVVIIKRESNGYIKFYAYKGNTTGYTEAVTTTTSTLYYD